MIATGDYARLAALTAPAFQWATGIRPEVIHNTDGLEFGEESPYACKLLLDDDEQYLCVDADVVFLHKWNVPDVPFDTFAAAPAQVHEPGVRAVAERYGGDPNTFLNTGLFIASKSHAPVMAQALTWMLEGFSRLHEESFLNCALQKAGTPILRLPLDVNLQRVTTVRATAIHACAQRGVEAKLRQITWLLQNFAPLDLLARVKLDPSERRRTKSAQSLSSGQYDPASGPQSPHPFASPIS